MLYDFELNWKKLRRFLAVCLAAVMMLQLLSGCAAARTAPAGGEDGAASEGGEEGGSPEEGEQEQAEAKMEKKSVGGWEISISKATKNARLENVSVILGYASVETSEFSKAAPGGSSYLMIKMKVEKLDGREEFKWSDLVVRDENGQEYKRIDDAFLTDLSMMRMTGTDLNFGVNEGWIVYEVDEDAQEFTLCYPGEPENYEMPLILTPLDELNSEAEDGERSDVDMTESFADQERVDAALYAEAFNGYTISSPQVVVDPYGSSPLTAVVIFETQKALGGKITVRGKSPEDDVHGDFPAARRHVVPVYGLYNDDTTHVDIELSDGQKGSLDITTEDVGHDFGTIEARMIDKSAYDYSQMTFMCSMMGAAYMLDSKGDVRWYYNSGGALGMHQLSNGHLMIPTSYTLKTSYYKAGLREIDFTGKIYKELAVPGGMHHDFLEMEDGSFIISSDSQDLEAVEDHVIQIDGNTGEVLWELNVADILDKKDGASASNISDGTEEVDWCHNNGVAYDKKNDLLLMSCRHLDAIVAVHMKDKSLAWILGDPEGWNTISGDYFFTPEPKGADGHPFEWFYAQHNVSVLDNGDLALFDNGTAKVKYADNDNRVKREDTYSRAVVYHIDTENMTASQILSYGRERGPEWYSDWISGVKSLDGTADSLWVTSGSHLFDGSNDTHGYGLGDLSPNLMKESYIDQLENGKLAYEVTVSGSDFNCLTYRSFRVPMYQEGGAVQDVKSKGVALGSLKSTKEAALPKLPAVDEAESLKWPGWNFTLDETKMMIEGSYETELSSADIEDAYIVLSHDGEEHAYTLSSVPSDIEGGSKVTVTGYVAVDGYEQTRQDIYLLIEGALYDTKKSYDIRSSLITVDEYGNYCYGFDGKSVEVSSNMSDHVMVGGNDDTAPSSSLVTEESLPLVSYEIDQEIEKEASDASHTFDDPLVITNPYKNSPLTALVVFQTKEEAGVRVTVKGKDEKSDISGETAASSVHRVPVIGLYPGMKNTVVLELLDNKGAVTKTKEIEIETNALSDFFDNEVIREEGSGESAFGMTLVYGQRVVNPYAFDVNGDVRWVLVKVCHNYGIFPLSNGRFLFQSEDAVVPTYMKPMSALMYEMDYLGRAWNAFYVANGTHHDIMEKGDGGNFLVLSNSLEGHEEDMIVEIDRKTGKEVKRLSLSSIFGSDITRGADWAHLNTVSYDTSDGTVLLSARNVNSAIRLDWETGEIKWILSNPEQWKGTEYEKYVLKPEGDFDWHYQQHSVYAVKEDLDGDPGTVEISMFDNHNTAAVQLDSSDNVKDSSSKVYSVDEKAMTVKQLCDLPCEFSDITCNTIYDDESGHIFTMSVYLNNKRSDGRVGMIYEQDYGTGEVINRCSLKHKAYRAWEMVMDYEDMSTPLKLDENYIKGELRPLVETKENTGTPVGKIGEELEMKLVGDVFYVQAADHTISQVIFRGKDHAYVYDATSVGQTEPDYMSYDGRFVMPVGSLAKDEYSIWMVYRNELVDTGEIISAG